MKHETFFCLTAIQGNVRILQCPSLHEEFIELWHFLYGSSNNAGSLSVKRRKNTESVKMNVAVQYIKYTILSHWVYSININCTEHSLEVFLWQWWAPSPHQRFLQHFQMFCLWHTESQESPVWATSCSCRTHTCTYPKNTELSWCNEGQCRSYR